LSIAQGFRRIRHCKSNHTHGSIYPSITSPSILRFNFHHSLQYHATNSIHTFALYLRHISDHLSKHIIISSILPHVSLTKSFNQHSHRTNMGSMAQRTTMDAYEGGDYSEILAAQENFAQLCQQTDAMSAYTRGMFEHTKHQLERLTHTRRSHSSTSAGSVTSDSSLDLPDT